MVDNQQRRLFVPFTAPRFPGNLVEIDSYGNVQSRPSTSPVLTGKFTNRNNNMADIGKIAKGAQNLYENNPYFREGVNAATSKVKDEVKTRLSNRPGGGGGGGIVDIIKGPSDNGGAIPYLSDVPNPAETKLNTGIKLTMIGKNYTKTEENVCSPVHITCAKFQFPIDTTSLANSWFLNTSTRDLQTRVQEIVNWAVDVGTKFSANNIASAMDKLFYALQVYYFYRSIDAYCYDGTNQNDAMRTISAEFDFNTRYKVAELQRQLSRTPIPPNMLEFARWSMGNYYSGDTPGSSIIKIIPFSRFSQAALTTNTTLDTVLAYFSDSTNIDVWNTLGRAMKSWVPGDPAKIMDPPIFPVYDKDFVTLFNNLPFYTAIAGNLIGPIAATSGTTYSYMSWNNNMDGILPAFTDAYAAGIGYNGMVKSFGASGHSRYSYYVVSGTAGWYPERTYPFLSNSRLDTYTSNGTTLTAYHRFGSDMVISLTPVMQITTCQNAVDFLMSKDLIKGTNVQSDNNPRSRRRRGGR